VREQKDKSVGESNNGCQLCASIPLTAQSVLTADCITSHFQTNGTPTMMQYANTLVSFPHVRIHLWIARYWHGNFVHGMHQSVCLSVRQLVCRHSCIVSKWL